MRILYVEDDASVVQSVQLMLETEGHSCDATESGKRAVELAKSGKYDIILLDIMLPDIDGYEVIKRLRASGVRTPILIQTGLVGDGIRHDGLSLGVSQYLVKPFNKTELIERIQGVVSGAGHRVPSDTAVQQVDEESPRDDGDERRQHRRFETSLPATILHNDGIDCIILNMSYGGAALQLPSSDTNCPPVFDLQIAFGTKFRCKVCWRFQDKIGVKGEAGWTEGLIAAQSDQLAPAVAEKTAPDATSTSAMAPSRFSHEDEPAADAAEKLPVEGHSLRASVASSMQDQQPTDAAGQTAEPATMDSTGEADETLPVEVAEEPAVAVEPDAAAVPDEPAPVEAAEEPTPVTEPEVTEVDEPAPVEAAEEPTPAAEPETVAPTEEVDEPAPEEAPAEAAAPQPAEQASKIAEPVALEAPAQTDEPVSAEMAAEIVAAPAGPEPEAAAPAPPAAEEQPAPSAVTAPLQAKAAEEAFVVDSGVRLVAETLECSELLVKGHLDATVRAGRLWIAPGGQVVGSAEVGAADVAGRFEGTLTVAGRLAIDAEGVVSGRACYNEIVIEPGGQISGEIQSTAANSAAGPDEKAAPRSVAAS